MCGFCRCFPTVDFRIAYVVRPSDSPPPPAIVHRDCDHIVVCSMMNGYILESRWGAYFGRIKYPNPMCASKRVKLILRSELLRSQIVLSINRY